MMMKRLQDSCCPYIACAESLLFLRAKLLAFKSALMESLDQSPLSVTYAMWAASGAHVMGVPVIDDESIRKRFVQSVMKMVEPESNDWAALRKMSPNALLMESDFIEAVTHASIWGSETVQEVGVLSTALDWKLGESIMASYYSLCPTANPQSLADRLSHGVGLLRTKEDVLLRALDESARKVESLQGHPSLFGVLASGFSPCGQALVMGGKSRALENIQGLGHLYLSKMPFGFGESNYLYTMPHSALTVSPWPVEEIFVNQLAVVHARTVASLALILRDVKGEMSFKQRYRVPEATLNELWQSVAHARKITDSVIESVTVPQAHSVRGPTRVKAVRHAMWMEARSWGYRDESTKYGAERP